MIGVRKQLSESPVLDFQTIKSDDDSLFNKLNLPEKPAAHTQKNRVEWRDQKAFIKGTDL